MSFLKPTIGGLILSGCVLFYNRMYGRVLGISGKIKSLLKAVKYPENKLSLTLPCGFIAGLMAAGAVFRTGSAIPNALSQGWIVVSGFLVGCGVTLGNGCTSGHGLCGLSRLSVRSFAFVSTFIAVAMATQTWLRAIGPLAASKIDIAASALEPAISTSTGLLLLATLLGWHAVAMVAARTKFAKAEQSKLQLVSSAVIGFYFGSGLILSGMTDPDKVKAFLSLPTVFLSSLETEFDPSLMLVMGAAIVPNLILFPPWMLNKKPLLNTKSDFPTRTDVDYRLMAGALLFGIGWGIAGICPGPAVVAIPSNPWVVFWWIGFIPGAWLFS